MESSHSLQQGLAICRLLALPGWPVDKAKAK